MFTAEKLRAKRQEDAGAHGLQVAHAQGTAGASTFTLYPGGFRVT